MVDKVQLIIVLSIIISLVVVISDLTFGIGIFSATVVTTVSKFNRVLRDQIPSLIGFFSPAKGDELKDTFFTVIAGGKIDRNQITAGTIDIPIAVDFTQAPVDTKFVINQAGTCHECISECTKTAGGSDLLYVWFIF